MLSGKGIIEVRRILSVNSTTRGSTGRIICQISRTVREEGFDFNIAYGRGDNSSEERAIRIGTRADIYWHGLVTRLTGRHGFSSTRATKEFLKEIDKLQPDLIHLHNIHGYYLNIELLFNYIREKEIPVVWTLHDCWAFTGHCAYFDFVGCEKWKNQCYQCPQIHNYPKSLFMDYSRKAYERKKKLFTGLKNLTIITPSNWLKDLVGQSFLKEYRTIVINNGVDTTIFAPRSVDKSKYGVASEDFVILGVAAKFKPRKGLNYFIELSEKLASGTKIFLVGLNDEQIKFLPESIIGMKRTENIEQLAELYSMTDVFVNPTLEDNFPTTNLEALACGTPVITFRTGGSPETIDNTCGLIVDKGDTEGLFNAIEIVKKRGKEEYTKNCRKRVIERFDSGDRFREYVELYGKLLNNYKNIV